MKTLLSPILQQDFKLDKKENRKYSGMKSYISTNVLELWNKDKIYNYFSILIQYNICLVKQAIKHKRRTVMQ